jgi:hypothetical protein
VPAPGGNTDPPGGTPPPTGTDPAPAGPPDPVTANGITITSITPGNGPAGGGTAVMITGSGFPAYPVVYIGGVGAYVQSGNSSVLTVIAPAGAAGSVASVTVSDRTGRSVTLANAFRYDADQASGGTTPGVTPPGATPGSGTPGTGTPGTGTPGTGTPGTGTPGTGTPGPGSSGPGTSAPGTSPSGPPVASGPPGSVRRTTLRLGQVTVRGGLHLAPVLANLSPAFWTTSRCETVLCRGVAI